MINMGTQNKAEIFLVFIKISIEYKVNMAKGIKIRSNAIFWEVKIDNKKRTK